MPTYSYAHFFTRYNSQRKIFTDYFPRPTRRGLFPVSLLRGHALLAPASLTPMAGGSL